MKMHFVTSARYPTEKAYGVTVGNTMSMLTKTKIQNSVFVWGEIVNDEYKNKIETIKNKPLRLPLQLYNSKLKTLSQFSFLINQVIFSIYFTKFWKGRDEASILWTREPLTLIVHSIFNPNARYLVELHHSIGALNRNAIRFLARNRNLQIAVLTDELQIEYSRIFPNTKTINLPMGVPESFFSYFKLNESKDFVIGYLGKGFSSGYDNDLQEVVFAAKELDHVTNLKFKFIGLEKEYKEKLQKLILDLGISLNKISFIDHLNHGEIPNEISKFHLGVIPYPESKYNSERFPIKILEYAAMGLPMIASNTKSHRSILSESFAVFYEKGDVLSLSNLILTLSSNPKKYESMSKNARSFALKFTYNERVRKLLSSIN